jgi:predicted negative regulator of RcsB-dependent stress response
MDTYAWVFFKEKKYLAALEWINQAVKVTQSPTILEHYGDILFFCNKLDEAIQQWNKAKDAGNKSDVLQRKIKDKKWYE